ncbi:MAG: EAL domain-containing protein [Pseudomonadota bacterium]|nr:EAL domain-containing protein [Pseudomonadota bacterium]
MTSENTKTINERVVRWVSLTALVAVGSAVAFGWWAASTIDRHALNVENQLIRTGLDDLKQRIPLDQDSSAVWNDSVLNARSNNGPWLAENLVEWMGEYYGYQRVYLLDALDKPLRAAQNGEFASVSIFEEDASALKPLIATLRDKMAAASMGKSDSTEAITGMGVIDYVHLLDGTVAIASVRPIIPEAGEIFQAPGTEFLHIVIKRIDSKLTAKMGQRFGIDDLTFALESQVADHSASLPITNNAGRTLGILTWNASNPASSLIARMAPIALPILIAGFLLVSWLLRRLQHTSADLKKSEAHSTYLAFHDALTGLPNRALFEDRLRQALASRVQRSGTVALHFVDLDGFKNVNDTLGHPAGDQLLKEVAQRLKTAMREADTVARLGGDEFAIIQTGSVTDHVAEQFAAYIVEELERPFDLNGDQANIGTSIGIALSSASDTVDDMMRKADIALYQAKENGRGRFQLFLDDMDDLIRKRRAIERDLRASIEGDFGLRLAYQPIYCGQTNKLLGVEALLRWDHHEHSNLGPDVFVPIAEKRGLITPLGQWVLDKACAFAASSRVPWVAINVSPVQFQDDRLAEKILTTIESHGLEPKRIQVEITEGLLLQNSPVVQDSLRQLRQAGVQVALDDFGTGYSSITYLRIYGVDKLKIDRSFVDRLGLGEDLDSIVRAIIELARSMGLKVTAEGVEYARQRDFLTDIECDELQGYLLSRPLFEHQIRNILSLPSGNSHQL